jgi:hypothetical protein
MPHRTKFGRVVVYSESTRTVTHYLETTLTLIFTYTTSYTYNSMYTVNVPIKQRSIVAVALVPLMLKPSALPKPPTGETAKFCLECGA